MTLNPSGQATSAIEVIDGTISEFYNLMDQCIRKSEVMPGQYKTITSPSYSNNCPINEGAFTTIDIGTVAPNVVDMDNSFITANIKVPVTFPAGFKADGSVCTFFVGWKSSLDALKRYNIYCNNKPVIDQINVGEESYILQSIIPEHVRCRKPYQYTTWDNVQNFSPNVCGTYITLSSGRSGEEGVTLDTLGQFTVEVEIPIKLDLNQFLLFQNFKYLPGFCGTWSIKIIPSTENMIVCQVDPMNFLTVVEKNTMAGIDLSTFSHHFVQKDDRFTMINEIDLKAKTVKTVTQKLGIGKCKVDEVLYHQTTFQLMYDIFDGLKARYMARPLAIPVIKLEYGRFSGEMTNKGTSSTYTVSIQNCNSIFIIPYIDDFHHTVCFNPKFNNMVMNISSFGNYPSDGFNTYGYDEKHTRFVNMTLDALNVNNSPIMAPNKELLNSLGCSQVNRVEVKATDIVDGKVAGVKRTTAVKKQWDQSNFIIGIPFANDVDFQGGLTSNGNISLKLTAGESIIAECHNMLTGESRPGSAVGATVMFCLDGAIFIKPMPYSDQPETRLVMERIV